MLRQGQENGTIYCEKYLIGLWFENIDKIKVTKYITKV